MEVDPQRIYILYIFLVDCDQTKVWSPLMYTLYKTLKLFFYVSSNSETVFLFYVSILYLLFKLILRGQYTPHV